MPDVQLLKLRPASTAIQSINEAADAPLVSTLHGTQATRTLWNDAAATTVNLGAGANVATMQVGVATTTVTVPGNLTVSGTVTTISSTNLVVNDPLIYANSGGLDPSFAGLAWDQGAALDVILVWNPTNSRIEVGRFNTVGGTVVPAAALTTLADFRVNNLTLDGTQIAFDGLGAVDALGVGSLLLRSSGGEVSLQTLSAQAVRIYTDGVDRWDVSSAGHFLAGADNTYDIGASGGTRPRTVYAGTTFSVGTANPASMSNSILQNTAIGYTVQGTSLTLIGSASSVVLSANSNVWFVDGPTGKFGTSTDNTLDIGGSAANRPRTIYAGTSIDVRDVAGTTGVLIDQATGAINLYRSGSVPALIAPNEELRIQTNSATPIVFATSSTNRWQVESGGHFAPISDNSVDIGTTTARVRSLRAGTNIYLLDVAGTTGLLFTQSTGNITLYRTGGTASISVPSDNLLIQVTTAAKTISIDAAGAGGSVSVTAAGAMFFQSSGGAVTVGPAAAFDLTLQGRSATITLNEAGNTTLSGFTATSIVGALNELKASGTTGSSFTNGEAGTITAGQVVYIDAAAARTVMLADATNSGGAFAGNVTQAIAVARANVLTTATGSFQTSGRVNAAFIAGLTLNDGDEVFLAKTAGHLTNDVSAYVTGDVVRSMGFVSDASAYTGVLGDLAEIELVHGPVTVV